MSDYRLLSYELQGRACAGVLVAGRLHQAAKVLEGSDLDGSSILALLQDWEAADALLADRTLRLDPSAGVALEDARLLAPVLYPNAIYCAAANYRDHMHAMAVKLGQPDEPDPHELDIKPYHFVVPGRSCTSGPHDPARLPAHGGKIDWEIELVAVIGKPAKNVGIETALDYVAGYMIGNDLSVRDTALLKIPNVPAQSLFRTDFVGMKGFDQACAFGPWITPSRYVQDPQSLWLRLWLDGELMQDSHTSQMVFSTAEQIAHLSSRVTLLPGDLVMTGTPAGTGMERDRFLRPGETLRLAINQLGEFTQRVIAAI